MAGDEWVSIRLGEVCTKIGSGATPRGGSGVYLDSGLYSLIRSQNVYNDGFHSDGLAFIGEEHATELSNVEVLPGDVLLNITGDSVARCCQVNPSVLPARVNQHVAIVRPDPEKLDPRFLRYFLVAPDTQAQLLSWAGAGATRNALTKGMSESFEVSAPKSVTEQRAIAHILGTLDEKIELNRRMNETLEAIVRALFKSWFVDFDPVRAKMEGRDPGLPKHIADIFPDRFEESGQDEIPAGWRVLKFGDFIKRLNVGQKHDQWSSLPKGKVPILDQGKSGVIGYHNDEPGVKASLDEPVAVFANHTCYMRLVTYSFSAIQNVLPFVGADVDTVWVYYATHGRLTFSEYKGHWPDFTIQEATVPPQKLTAVFGRIVREFIGMIRRNEKESHTLTTLLDTLLPKLISGELRVESGAKEIREVT